MQGFQGNVSLCEVSEGGRTEGGRTDGGRTDGGLTG